MSSWLGSYNSSVLCNNSAPCSFPSTLYREREREPIFCQKTRKRMVFMTYIFIKFWKSKFGNHRTLPKLLYRPADLNFFLWTGSVFRISIYYNIIRIRVPIFLHVDSDPGYEYVYICGVWGGGGGGGSENKPKNTCTSNFFKLYFCFHFCMAVLALKKKYKLDGIFWPWIKLIQIRTLKLSLSFNLM